MSTEVDVRLNCQEQYARWRISIFDYYDAMALVGRGVDGKTYKLPRKLDHWSPSHSSRVRAACPELESAIHAIEVLAKGRRDVIVKGGFV